MTQKILCPCCSMKESESCCEPLHQGVFPKNALQLMRSRYSAYVLNLPDYIIATTHPSNPQYTEDKLSWKRSISHFSRNSTFHKLEIHHFEEKEISATVTFTAYLSQNRKDATFTEKSYFEKLNGLWLYHSGDFMNMNNNRSQQI